MDIMEKLEEIYKDTPKCCNCEHKELPGSASPCAECTAKYFKRLIWGVY